MLLRRCYNNIIRRQLSSARPLHTLEASEAQEIHQENTAKAARKSRKPSNKDVLKDLTSAAKERQHNDLTSFLQYASKTGLDPKSTVYVGTHYEYLTQSSLSRLGFTLLPTGGSNDYGIDLLGTLRLPIPKHPISMKVIVQCKALASRGGPNLIRELEGAFSGAPHTFRGPSVLGLLVMQKPATKGMRDALGRSNWPMGCVTITPEKRVIQMLWNRRAEEEGLEGVDVGVRYANESAEQQEVMLLWKGEAIRVGK